MDSTESLVDSATPQLSRAQSEALDGLRGIAILAVLAFHTGFAPMRWGFLGVDMFFTISGFVISKVLVEEYSQTGSVSFKRFYLRRAGRLFPALVLLVAVLAISTLFITINKNLLFMTIVWALAYILNWVIIAGWPIHGALSHTWSLAVEEQFYLIWPIALIALLKQVKGRPARIFVLLTVVLAIGVLRIALWKSGASNQRLYNGSDLRLDSLLLGAAIYLSGSQRGWIASRWATGAILICIVVYLCFAPWDQAYSSAHLYLGGLSLVAFGTGAAILEALREGGFIQQAVRARPLRWIGEISYSLYLWHYPVFLLTHNRPLLGIPLSFFASLISYYLVEKPVRSFVRSRTEVSRFHRQNGETPSMQVDG